jgi:hypothetical protein
MTHGAAARPPVPATWRLSCRGHGPISLGTTNDMPPPRDEQPGGDG